MLPCARFVAVPRRIRPFAEEPMNPLRAVVVLVAVATPVAVAALLHGAAPGQQAAKRVAPLQVELAQPKGPVITGLPLGGALKIHEAMMIEARKTQVSTVMPVPTPHSAGRVTAAAEVTAPRVDVPSVPASRKFAIFFSGNAVGETDPCG